MTKHDEMAEFLRELNEGTLGAYEKRRSLVQEHWGIEQNVLAGGYGYRQILELIQNGADAILEAHEDGYGAEARIEVLLTKSHLYVANTGAAISKEGIDALLSSHSSTKRGNQIGRFGLGFKSLLRLDGVIDIFSKTWGGIRFDPQRCRHEIKERFGGENAPGLRMAWSQGHKDRFADSMLGRLGWAETIVRVEIADAKLVEPLRAEILEFPAEFLLFNPIPIQLALDVGGSEPRVFSVEGEGETRDLVEGDKRSAWRLFQMEVPVTDEAAKSDATHIHDRNKVPVAWAVPVAGRREETGRFWAFFPTKTPTYLPGILNAPWKLNNDRQGLITGAWNEMLMKAAAELVTRSIMSLSEAEDPAKHLDSFPRTRRPSASDLAIPLLEAIWSHLETAEVIPDCNKDLRPGNDLLNHPTSEGDLLEKWMALVDDEEVRAEFVHPSCLRRERKARLAELSRRLIEKHGDGYWACAECKWEDWIASVASAEEEKAKDVIRLVHDVHRHCTPEDWSEVQPKLRVIPDRSGGLRRPDEVMIGPPEELPPDVSGIATWLLEDPELRRILRTALGVAELEGRAWLERLNSALVRAIGRWSPDSSWEDFWQLLLASPRDVALGFARDKKQQIKVANREGEWVTPAEVLLPGRLVSGDDDENSQALVHATMHGEGRDFLFAVGVTDLPEGETVIEGDWEGRPTLACFSAWLRGARDRYKAAHQNSARRDYLSPKFVALPNGWHFLSHLMGRPAAILTHGFLKWLGSDSFRDEVVFGHLTVDRYSNIRVEHPLLIHLLICGEFQIGEQTVWLRAVLEEADKSWFARVPDLAKFRRAFDKLLGFHKPETVSDEDRKAFWNAVISAYITGENLLAEWTAAIWNGAAEAGVHPTGFVGAGGTLPLESVYVTTSRELADRVRSDDDLVFVLSAEAVQLWAENGAKQLAEGLTPGWKEARPGVSLIEAFPEVQTVLSAKMAKSGVAIRVTELVMQFNESAMPIPCLLQDHTLYFDGDTLDQMPLTERLTVVLTELGNAGALRCSVGEALVQLIDTQVSSRRAHVAAGKNLETRLLRAVGGKPGPLRRVLGELGQQSFVRNCGHEDLARIVLRHLGPSVLPALVETLEAEGLAPPGRWGTAEAREFVRQLGLPEEFGAARTARREPEEWSQGPFPLPPLHDFQEEVRDGVKAMIDREKTNRKAVISLPTGGGKTRVTVEMAVEFTLKPETDRRGVLWIAQTDELCEQAVQAFRQVWPNRGAERTGLRIIRMWGGNPTPSMPAAGEPFVVVASIQTLDARGGIPGGDWASRFGMLVIDECHHAITPSYTRLLRFVGFDARAGEEQQNHELVSLGLSATPFRMDDDESQRLAKRFANRWFPHNQEDLHRRLLKQGVLCQVTNEELQSGTGLSSLEEDELGQLDDLDGFGAEQLLERINQRLGDHGGRNIKLVERIDACEEQSILLFANSVSHACEMAARLNLAGIPSAAVSATTSRNARRYFLEQFQRGELRVLCNHSVLTTGFDAPKTDMLLIARQVFSPVRYMQMVGRGLRGVKNGGTERCRIVTVLDNLGRFQNKHPYHFCKRFFVNYQE